MAMLPEADKEHQYFLDFLSDACKKPVRKPQSDGTFVIEQEVDWKKPYYKLQNINYPGYSRMVFETERLEGMANDLFNRMAPERARVIFEQIMSYVDSIRYSMDAKSSETVRNKDNTQSNLTNLLTKIRVDRNYSTTEEMKKSAFSALFGDKDKDAQQQQR
jgi:hypothetical protein